MKRLTFTATALSAISTFANAHCPLCVAGAAAAAGTAYYFGVSTPVIGVFIGAFGIAMGSFVAKNLKKQFIPMQKQLLEISSFLLTVLPLYTLFSGFYPFYVSLFGDYGSIFNSTYLISSFLTGSILGGIAMLVSPYVNNLLKSKVGLKMQFQGIAIALILLLLLSVVLQFS